MTQILRNCALAVAAVACIFGINRGAAAQIMVDLSDDGALTIVGDNSSNAVFIRVEEDFTISTHTESFSFDTIAITSVTIQLGKDIDQVYIDLFHPLVADLSISTGQDFDRVELRDHQAGGAEYSNAIIGNIEINTGHGDDYIAMSSVAVIGNVEISTGNGRDVIQFNSVSDSLAFAGSNDILGNLSINTGVDIDQVNFERFATNVEQNLDLELGQGNDALWGGINLLNLANGTAFLSGGQGYDTCPDDLIIAAEIIKIGFED